jgi:hypothetical protein
MVAFRMGADDARGMQRYFEPKFEEYDLVHMDNRNFVINMTIGGEKVPAFSATTLDLPPQHYDETAQIVEHSRAQHAVTRQAAEEYIHQRYDLKAKPASQPKSSVKTSHKTTPKPPAKEPEPKPQVQSQAPPANPAERATGMGQAAVSSIVEIIKPKRRRRRSRRNNRRADEQQEQKDQPVERKPQQPSPQSHRLAETPENTEHTIFKR